MHLCTTHKLWCCQNKYLSIVCFRLKALVHSIYLCASAIYLMFSYHTCAQNELTQHATTMGSRLTNLHCTCRRMTQLLWETEMHLPETNSTLKQQHQQLSMAPPRTPCRAAATALCRTWASMAPTTLVLLARVCLTVPLTCHRAQSTVQDCLPLTAPSRV